MKLYFFPIAPNPTRVRLYLAEKAAAGTPIKIEQLPVDLRAGEQRSDAHRARNPLQKLPVLELDDGTYLLESLAIIEYLEELHPEPALIGRDPLERARVREHERIAEMGVLRGAASIVHATNSPLGLPPLPELAAAERPGLEAALRVLEERFGDGRPFVAGARVTIADCTLAAALQFARFGKVELPGGLERLLAWDARYRERAPAQSVLLL